MAISVVKTEDISSVSVRGDASQSPEEVEESLRLIEDLKFFLATAPANWQENQVIRRYYLSNDEGFVSCVFWNNLYYITGTDIVRCCAYRMQKFGREIVERKKFEEGIFSDLRNLKCGIDATLEKPKSDFLKFLYKNMCLKTQKKQKVFFWFSVPHDRLFADALERDLKRVASGGQPTTKAVAEPALSFKWEANSDVSLYDQITHHVDSQRTESRPVSAEEEGQQQQSQSQSQSQSQANQQLHNKQQLQHVADTPVSAAKEIEPYELGSVQEEEAEVAIVDNDKLPYGLPSGQEVEQTNYEPQQLVVPHSEHGDEVPAEFGELNDDLKPSDILASNQEEDDFPLDYFPVEIEYSQTSMDSSLHVMPQGSKMSTQMMFYEDMDGMMAGPKYPISAGLYEDPFFRDEMAVPVPVPNSAKYMMPPPMSASRSQFMTNGEYYSKSKENKKPVVAASSSSITTSNSNNKTQTPDLKRSGDEDINSPTSENDAPEEENDTSEQSQEQDSSHRMYQTETPSNEEYLSAPYNNRRMQVNESMVHPYTGMLLNPYMFYNMLAVDPAMTMGVNPMTDPFYGQAQAHNMDVVHDMYPPQEVVYPSNYRTTPKAAYFNMRSPYGRNFPPPSAMNPYYTPYHRRHPSSGTRRYFNKAAIINKKMKSPPRKGMVSKPTQKSMKVNNGGKPEGAKSASMINKDSDNAYVEFREEAVKDYSNDNMK